MAVGYRQGLGVAVATVNTSPLKGTLNLRCSLTDGAQLTFTARGQRMDLVHIVRGATVTVTDVDSGTLLFSGHVLTAEGRGYSGGTGLVDVKVEAAGIEQQVFRRLLTAANARAVNLADTATAQLGELVTVLGTGYSSGSVHTNVNRLVGAAPGSSVGEQLRRLGDIQRIGPDGEIDLIMREGLTSAATITREHDSERSGYQVALDTAVGRVLALGADVRFIATGTLQNVTEGGVTRAVATITSPTDTEVVTVDTTIARQDLAGKFDEGDELDGVWDPDHNRFEWSGTLSSGQTALVEMYGAWRTEIVVEATNPPELARDTVLRVPSTATSDIRNAANRALRHGQDPVETMSLDILFGAQLDRFMLGDAVMVDIDLQNDLDVHQPVATDLWLVHWQRITQPGAAQAKVVLGLSRRLPDARNRDFWSRGDEGVTGMEGRQIVIGGGTGAPQIAQVIPTQTVRPGDTLTLDLGEYFSDPDGDMLIYVATSSDTSLATVSLSGDTLTLTGVAEGTVSITVTASDMTRSAAQIFTTNVMNNRAPVVVSAIPDQTVGAADVRVDVSPYFSDPEFDELTYMAVSADATEISVIVDDDEIVLTNEEGSGTNAEVTITVTASDGTSSVSQDFTATALDVAVIPLGTLTITQNPFPTPEGNDSYLIGITYPANSRKDISTWAGTPAFLRRIEFNEHTAAGRSSVLHVTQAQTGDPGVDLGDTFENGAASFRLSADGISDDLILPGPNYIMNVQRDSDGTPTYQWQYDSDDSGDAVTAIRTFRTAYDALTATQKDSATLRMFK